MNGLRRALIAIAVAAVLLGLITVPVVLSCPFAINPWALLVGQLTVGWSFVATGLWTWWRRPENRLGMLMTALGFVWLLGFLQTADNGYLIVLALAVSGVPYALLVQLLLSFPDGRLHSRGERALVAAAWVDATILQWIPLPFQPFRGSRGCPGCPPDPILIHGHAPLGEALDGFGTAVAALILVGLVIALVGRRRALAPGQRKAFAPVLWAGGLALIGLTATMLYALSGGTLKGVSTVYLLGLIPLAAVPYVFLAGVLRFRLSRTGAVNALIASLSATREPPTGIRDALADALDDPALVLAYWLPERHCYVDAEGHEVTPDAIGQGRDWTAVERDGKPLAAIIHADALSPERKLIRAAGAAAVLALENERLQIELRTRVHELEQAREHLIAAGVAERRRLERDLHDGAQQRLVALALGLRLARDRIEGDPAGAAAMLTEAMRELDAATGELRELARGIHPSVLSNRGLPAAVNALASRLPMPVLLAEAPSERLPTGVEVASYYVIAEALTNVARYARASSAEVHVRRVNGHVSVQVSDDGVGGADPARGSGLRGLADRVSAIDGTLRIESAPGIGTTVTAEIPCA